jgi:hypothetical protein
MSRRPRDDAYSKVQTEHSAKTGPMHLEERATGVSDDPDLS